MKVILEGKTYDTATSAKHGKTVEVAPFLLQTLYETQIGFFFLFQSRNTGESIRIIPVTAEEADEWLKDHSPSAKLPRTYWEPAKSNSNIPLRLPPAMRARLQEEAQAKGMSLNAYLMLRLE